MTIHLYHKYPGMSPGLLTDLRSASVNNDCYARSAVKAKLHQHILHSSQQLYKHIVDTVDSFDKLHLETTFGWESESTFPKVSQLVEQVFFHLSWYIICPSLAYYLFFTQDFLSFFNTFFF